MGQQFSWEEAEENGAVGAVDAAQLQEWYKKFLEECPSGTLFMHEFKRFFKVPDNEEATQYVEGMFRAFDTNGVRCPKGGKRELRAHPWLKEHPQWELRSPALLLGLRSSFISILFRLFCLTLPPNSSLSPIILPSHLFFPFLRFHLTCPLPES